jgi:hypothetical protein
MKKSFMPDCSKSMIMAPKYHPHSPSKAEWERTAGRYGDSAMDVVRGVNGRKCREVR